MESMMPDEEVPPSFDRTYAEVGLETLSSFDLEMNVTLKSWNQEVQILFNAQDDDNFYELGFRGRGINDMFLRKKVNGSYTDIPRSDTPSMRPMYGAVFPTNVYIAQDKAYKLKIVSREGAMKFYLDGQLIFEAVDTTFTSGKLALSTYRTDAYFDDMKGVNCVPGPSLPYQATELADGRLRFKYKDRTADTDNDGRVLLEGTLFDSFYNREAKQIQLVAVSNRSRLIPQQVVFLNGTVYGVSPKAGTTGIYEFRKGTALPVESNPDQTVVLDGIRFRMDIDAAGALRLSEIAETATSSTAQVLLIGLASCELMPYTVTRLSGGKFRFESISETVESQADGKVVLADKIYKAVLEASGKVSLTEPVEDSIALNQSALRLENAIYDLNVLTDGTFRLSDGKNTYDSSADGTAVLIGKKLYRILAVVPPAPVEPENFDSGLNAARWSVAKDPADAQVEAASGALNLTKP